jgi:hypothetical protein
MEKISRKRGGALAGALALAAALLLPAASFPAAALAGDEPTACETVSLAFVGKTLGLPHATLLRDKSNLEDTSGLEPSELPFAFHSECGIGLWSGAPPKGQSQIYAKARAGQAAQVGVDVWAPDTQSPEVNKWEETEYGEVLDGLQKGRFQVLLKLPGQAKGLNPKGEGYSAQGLTIKTSGPAHGLEAAAGCWWDPGTHRIVCLFTEEAEGKPVVDHLNKLAAKIVPNFLAAP